MRVVRPVIAGVVAALAAVILWVLAKAAFMSWSVNQPGSGVGLIVVSVDTVETFLAAIVGFALGFWWSVRRAQKRADNSRHPQLV